VVSARLRGAILHRSGFQGRRLHHPDPTIRRKAIDLTRRGIDSLRAVGRRILTLWLGQDGFDDAFPQQPHFPLSS
jgi:L-rhamnose isomerase